MATAWIRYYSRLAQDANGAGIAAGLEPAVGEDKVTFTTSAQSAVVPAGATFAEIVVDAAAHVEFGFGTVTADSDNLPIAANANYFRGVAQGGRFAFVQKT